MKKLTGKLSIKILELATKYGVFDNKIAKKHFRKKLAENPTYLNGGIMRQAIRLSRRELLKKTNKQTFEITLAGKKELEKL